MNKVSPGVVTRARAGNSCRTLAVTPPFAARTATQVALAMTRSQTYSVPRAFRSGRLESIIRPVNGRLSSSMRKIAHAAEKANSDRQVKSVVFSGEKRL